MSNPFSERIAFVFPGQGAQVVGMGKDLYDSSPAARRVFEVTDSVTGVALTKLCFEGPQDVLTDTYNAQTAILTASMAAYEALKERLEPLGVKLQPALLAGHSLGEYTALVVAGSLTLEDGIKLVRERGRLMKAADEKYPGGMAAVLGMEDAEVEEVVKAASAKGVLILANYNCPGQVVISGDLAALTEAMRMAEARGAKKVVRLPISIAAHSPLMRPASQELAQAIRSTTIGAASAPVVANVTATPIASPVEIVAELSEQLCASVRWTQSVQYMLGQGIGTFLEIGPGTTLCGLIRRVSRDVRALNVGDCKTLDAFVASVTGA